MLVTNRWAFKEWAIICEVLCKGMQSLVLRKGGLHEPGGRFLVEHREFWLFPTRLHQNADKIREPARFLLDGLAAEPARTADSFIAGQRADAATEISVSLYAVVEEAIELTDPALLARLTPLQILASQTLEARFHYRRPGLFVLPVRIYRREVPVQIPNAPHFAGCRTWVDLERELPLDGLVPVLSDVEHAADSDDPRSARCFSFVTRGARKKRMKVPHSEAQSPQGKDKKRAAENGLFAFLNLAAGASIAIQNCFPLRALRLCVRPSSSSDLRRARRRRIRETTDRVRRSSSRACGKEREGASRRGAEVRQIFELCLKHQRPPRQNS